MFGGKEYYLEYTLVVNKNIYYEKTVSSHLVITVSNIEGQDRN